MQTKAVRMITLLFVFAALIALCTSIMAQGGGQGRGDAAGQGRGGGGGGGRGGAPPLLMTSSAWEDGGVIPDKFTQAAGATSPSPELKWSQVPMGTQSFVLLMHDPEPIQNRSAKMDITHWLVWNIPATSTGLPEGVATGELPDGTRQVSLRSLGYMGPGAGPGPYHHYTFELYALDTKLDIPQPAAGTTPQQVVEIRNNIVNAMDNHVIGKAILVARFHR
jgi:Raf kinase inhibitor-like YbhB/YbcL family protein